MSKQIVIIGAGGHGKVVADIARKNGYDDIVFLDDNNALAECEGYPVCGTGREFDKFPGRDFVVAIGNSHIRQALQKEIAGKGMRFATLVHPNAVVSESAQLGEGSVVMAGAVINPNAKIGKGCIVNTCASVDHDCCIGAYTHISVGAHIAGTVTIGIHCFVGAGAVVSNNIQIAEETILGAGAVVVKSIDQSGVYVGVPAKKIKEITREN